MPIVFSRGVIVVDENPNNITEIRTTSDAPLSYNTANQTYYKFDVTQSVGSRWIAQTNFFILPTLTAGSVLFSNGTTISQDNSNLFYDDTNNRLGIGTASPSERVSIVYNNNSYERGFSLNNTNTGTASISGFQLKHNSTAVANFDYFPYNYGNASLQDFASLNTLGATAGLILNTNAAGSDGAASGNIKIYTGGNTIPAIFVKGSDGSGNVGISNPSPTVALDVVGLSKMTYSGATAGTRVLKVDHLGTGGGNAAYISATGTTANSNNALYLKSSGSTTGNYGLQIEVYSSGFDNLAIESLGDAPSVFGGSIGIATYTPGTALDVAGEVTVQNRTSTPTILAGFTSGGILGDLSLSTELSIASGQFKLAQQSATDGQVLTWVNASSKWLPSTISVPSSSTSATPNTLVLRTSDANTKSNNNVDNFTTTATAAGTTTLTVASSKIQEFTGSTTQTITLPVVSTLTTGHKFEIINNSTGNLTVNSSGSNLVGIIGPGSAAHLTCDLITGTSAASWTFSIIANPIFGIPFMFGDGVNVLTVGSKNGIYIPFGYTILEWTLGSVNGTSGSIQLDLWVDSQANFPPTVADTITANAKPLFSSTTKGQSSTLTGWTTTIAPDRWLYVNVDSVTSINQLSGTLKCRKL